MSEKDEELIQEGWALFTRIFMKYDILGKAPLEISASEKLSASFIHMIEAVGKGYGNTITTLSKYFMITKGAVSQIITKLHKMGYIAKTKRKGNDKEIVLELTKKGWKAFELHEKRNEPTLDDLKGFLDNYSEDELRSFLSILTDIEHLLNKFIPQQMHR
jgi:DNA-binding MarR family transcriptional regulator